MKRRSFFDTSYIIKNAGERLLTPTKHNITKIPLNAHSSNSEKAYFFQLYYHIVP